jgi:hypothetical protein
MSGKVVVNRCMSLDGFIAGPGHSMDWGDGRALADFVAPHDFAEIAAATGAMLVGRRTWEVGDRMEAEKPGSVDYPFSGPMFLLTHRPLEPALAENLVRAGQAACSYSWRRPPRRSRLRTLKRAILSGSAICVGNWHSGWALAMPWWGRCPL